MSCLGEYIWIRSKSTTYPSTPKSNQIARYDLLTNNIRARIAPLVPMTSWSSHLVAISRCTSSRSCSAPPTSYRMSFDSGSVRGISGETRIRRCACNEPDKVGIQLFVTAQRCRYMPTGKAKFSRSATPLIFIARRTISSFHHDSLTSTLNTCHQALVLTDSSTVRPVAG